ARYVSGWGTEVCTVVGATPPTIGTPGANATIECPTTPSFTPPTANDTCDAHPSVVEVSDITTPGSCPGAYARTKTWKARDCTGNESGTVSQTIPVAPSTPPSLAPPGAHPTIECPATPSFTPPTANDTCDAHPSVVEVSDITTPGSCPGAYARTKTWKARDCVGNESGTVSQTITVVDSTPPTVGAPHADAPIASPGAPSFTPPAAPDPRASHPPAPEATD